MLTEEGHMYFIVVQKAAEQQFGASSTRKIASQQATYENMQSHVGGRMRSAQWTMTRTRMRLVKG